MTTVSGMTFFEDQFSSGAFEGVADNLEILNANSGGTITVQGAAGHQGRSQTITKFQSTSGLIQRRDPEDATTATPTVPANVAEKRIKIYRTAIQRWRPQDFRDQNLNTEEGSRLMGIDFGEQKIADYISAALSAARGGILKVDDGADTVVFDATGESEKRMNYEHLAQGLKLFGDAAGDITAWAIHGFPHGDIMVTAQADQPAAFQLNGLMIVEGSTPLIRRRGLIHDGAALLNLNGSLIDTFHTLGLRVGAVLIEETEVEMMDFGMVRGDESSAPANMLVQLSIEYAFTLSLLGMTYAGANNPNDATLATIASWTKTALSFKNTPGIAIVTQ